MVAVKAHQADAFLKSPDPKILALLLYGTDAGLIAERARTTANLLAGREDPAGEVIRIDDIDLETSPDRLAVELRTISMFGGRNVIRTATGRRINTNALKPLVADTGLTGLLIVEAGNLKPSDALRALFEKTAHAAAVACFPDDARDLSTLIDDLLTASGQTIDRDARQILIARLGADRALSRGEIEKLTLFTAGRNTITIDDVDAIVGDASELALDKILSAAASGETNKAMSEYSRSVASGESPQAVIAATQRYFHRLHRVRCEIDKGRSATDALRKLRPPVHFKQQKLFANQCTQWPAGRLQHAVSLISAAAKAARRSASIENVLAERMLLELARLAKRPGAHR